MRHSELGELPQVTGLAPVEQDALGDHDGHASDPVTVEPGIAEQRVEALGVEIRRHLAELSLLSLNIRHPEDGEPLTDSAPGTFYGIGRNLRTTADDLRRTADTMDALGDWAASATTLRKESGQDQP